MNLKAQSLDIGSFSKTTLCESADDFYDTISSILVVFSSLPLAAQYVAVHSMCGSACMQQDKKID